MDSLNFHVLSSSSVSRYFLECADREREIGFFITDFGDPMMLRFEDAGFRWNAQHDRVFARMLTFYPPELLNTVQRLAKTEQHWERKAILRERTAMLTPRVDIYAFGVLMLQIMLGG